MSNTKQTTLLQEVTISGYRSCQSTVFRPHPKLSVLIGINGVGKTNILNAIRLLYPQDMRRFSRPIPDDKSNAQTTITAWFLVDGKRIGLRLTLVVSQAGRSMGEVLSYSEEWSFASLIKSKKWVVYPSFLVEDDDNRNSAQFMIQRRYY